MSEEVKKKFEEFTKRFVSDEELFNSMISFFESSTEKHKREEIQRFR
jgi:hypothetical protein